MRSLPRAEGFGDEGGAGRLLPWPQSGLPWEVLVERGQGATLQGPEAPMGTRDASVSCRKTVLENGLRVITEQVPGVRSIAIGVLVDVGLADEPATQHGIAHLCEHLLFQGTSNRDALTLARAIDATGGQIGGFTARDYTCYFATVLDDYSFHALDLLGDALLNSTFPPERVESEKQAVIYEILARHDNPPIRVEELLRKEAWASHALGRPIAGDPAWIAALSREDLIYFVHGNYSPDRMVIAAAGHLEHDDFVASARDAFWRLLGEGPPRTLEPPVFQRGIWTEEAQLGQTYFALGLPAPAYASADRYAMHVLNQLFGGGISSRLFRRLREQHGLVYDISASYQAYGAAGMWVLQGSTAPERVFEVLQLTLAELRALVTLAQPADAEELQRAKLQLTGCHLIGSEDTHTRMSRLLTQELYFGQQLAAEQVVSAMMAVDASGLERLVRGQPWQLPPALALVGPGVSNPRFEGCLEEILREFAR